MMQDDETGDDTNTGDYYDDSMAAGGGYVLNEAAVTATVTLVPPNYGAAQTPADSVTLASILAPVSTDEGSGAADYQVVYEETANSFENIEFNNHKNSNSTSSVLYELLTSTASMFTTSPMTATDMEMTTSEPFTEEESTTRGLPMTRSTYYKVWMPHGMTTVPAALYQPTGYQYGTDDNYPFSRVPFFVTDAFTVLLALMGNILIVIGISRTKLSTPMVGYHRFILSLSVACLVTTSAIALSFINEIVLLFVPHPVLTRKCGETLLKGLMNVGFASALLSIAGLALDSFVGLFFDAEQYNATTKKRTREITIGIWLFAVGFGLTDLPLSIVHFFSTGGHRLLKSRETDFLDWCHVYVVNKYRLEYALLGVSMPCFIFVFATISRLVMEVRRADVCWSPNNPDRRWVFRRFVTTTFMLMGLFSIFWLPHTILEVSIVLVSAVWVGYTPPGEATIDFTRYVLRSWLLLGLLMIPIVYAIRFRRRVRRQLVDFFSAVCGNGDVNIPEIADDEEADAPTIRHLLACSSIVGYSFDDSRGSFRHKDSRKKALQRVKSCRV